MNIDFEKFGGDDSWLKWLGNHTITGLYNKQSLDFFNHATQARLRGKTLPLGASEYLSRGTSGIRDGNFRPATKSIWVLTCELSAIPAKCS